MCVSVLFYPCKWWNQLARSFVSLSYYEKCNSCHVLARHAGRQEASKVVSGRFAFIHLSTQLMIHVTSRGYYDSRFHGCSNSLPRGTWERGKKEKERWSLVQCVSLLVLSDDQCDHWMHLICWRSLRFRHLCNRMPWSFAWWWSSHTPSRCPLAMVAFTSEENKVKTTAYE